MVKKSTKSLSKRKTLADKYRVEKRVKAHKKKVKKLAKKNPMYKSKLKKDPGIPNLYPFKEQLMKLIKDDHDVEQAGKERQRKERTSLKKLASTAAAEGTAFDKRAEEEQRLAGGRGAPLGVDVRDNSRKAFYREFKRVVEESDVLLEVLDARDPMGCRARAVEHAILERGGKKIVLVLNKIDLVPQEVVTAWLAYLRQEFPTVAFRCNTQTQRSNLSRTKGDFETMDKLDGGACLGGDNLLELLKNYCRSQDIKKSITVGIIGFPNTGKSSLINSLKRTKAAAVGARPGVTRAMQEIKLDNNVVLLDCPGIVFTTSDDTNADHVLRNAVEMDKIADPVPVVDAVLRRCPRERLMELYQIPVYRSGEEFLAHVAHKVGKLKKGGVPDYRAAAVTVLRDWQCGKIKFFTLPPERTEKIVASEVVSGWAKEFNLEAIAQKEQRDLMPKLKSAAHMKQDLMEIAAGHEEDGQEFADKAFGDAAEGDGDEEADGMEQSSELVTAPHWLARLARCTRSRLSAKEESSDSSERDPYAQTNTKGGKLVMDVAELKRPAGGPKKRASIDAVQDEYVAPVSKATRKKELKRKKKRAATQGGAMEADEDEGPVEFDNAPYDFEADFVATSAATSAPNDDDDGGDQDEFDFKY